LNADFAPNIVPDSTSFDKRILLLNPKYTHNLEELPENVKKWIMDEEKPEILDYTLHVDYDSYSQEQLLKKFLPEGVNPVIKMNNIGEVKILDLDENQMKYKDQIAKIILDKSSTHTKTILLKREKVEDEKENTVSHFAEHHYELLSGQPNTIIDITEGKCNFKVNLLDIYYDSSSQQERERMLSTFGNKTQICDLFGDLFLSIRLGKQNNCKVIANCGQNAAKFSTFSDNIALNGVKDFVELKNLELGEFLKVAFEKEKLKKRPAASKPTNPSYLHRQSPN